jgi:hypothetical protein
MGKVARHRSLQNQITLFDRGFACHYNPSRLQTLEAMEERDFSNTAGCGPQSGAIYSVLPIFGVSLCYMVKARFLAYHQVPQVPAHAELMWILSCTASMGYLSRMTQWKVGILA